MANGSDRLLAALNHLPQLHDLEWPIPIAPMMQPLVVYEYLEKSRKPVLDAVRSLTAEQYASEFPIGMGTLGRVLTHILSSEWYYVQRLLKREVPPYDQWQIRGEQPLAADALTPQWNRQAADTRNVLQTIRDWDIPFDYNVTDDDGVPLIVTTTSAGLLTQLAFHEIHHRAQALNMLRQMDIELGDLDFNALMFTRRRAT